METPRRAGAEPQAGLWQGESHLSASSPRCIERLAATGPFCAPRALCSAHLDLNRGKKSSQLLRGATVSERQLSVKFMYSNPNAHSLFMRCFREGTMCRQPELCISATAEA